MIHSANAEGVPSQKDENTPFREVKSDESKRNSSARPATPAHKEPVHRRFATCKRDSIWTSQPLGCLFCAWPWLLTFRLRDSGGRDSIQSEI